MDVGGETENIAQREKKLRKIEVCHSSASLSAALINPKEYKEIRNKKGQPIPVDLSVLVEVAGFEPASVNPLPQALHA